VQRDSSEQFDALLEDKLNSLARMLGSEMVKSGLNSLSAVLG